MQNSTQVEDLLIRTAPVLKPVTRVEVVSRTNPNDVRLALDTGARDYDPERCGILHGSNVNVDVNRDTLRMLTLNIQDWTGDWFPGPNNKVWLDAYLKAYRGYVGTQYWKQGVYLLADPEVNDQGQVTLSGVDKSGRANGHDEGGFLEPVEIAKGTKIKTALEQLAGYHAWGETDLNLYPSDAVLPYKQTYNPGEFPWHKAVDLGRIPGNFRDLHHDEAGYLTWQPDPDPNLLAPVWDIWPDGSRPGTARPDEYSVYISASRQIDTHGLKNWVGVLGGSARSAPVFASATDGDSASPTSTARIGYRVSWWNGGRPDPLITTVADAQARADYELRRLRQWNERVPLRISELVTLQPWDVVRVINNDLRVNDTYQIVSYTLPLDASGEMQLQGWRPVKGAA